MHKRLFFFKKKNVCWTIQTSFEKPSVMVFFTTMYLIIRDSEFASAHVHMC